MSDCIRRGDVAKLQALLESGEISQAHYDALMAKIGKQDVLVENIQTTWSTFTIDNVVEDKPAE